MQKVIFGGHLENGGHFENFKCLMIDFGKVSHKDAFCQISCYYFELLFELSAPICGKWSEKKSRPTVTWILNMPIVTSYATVCSSFRLLDQ